MNITRVSETCKSNPSATQFDPRYPIDYILLYYKSHWHHIFSLFVYLFLKVLVVLDSNRPHDALSSCPSRRCVGCGGQGVALRFTVRKSVARYDGKGGSRGSVTFCFGQNTPTYLTRPLQMECVGWGGSDLSHAPKTGKE